MSRKIYDPEFDPAYAEMPPNGGPDFVAVVVRGDSMAGFAGDGATLYYRDRREPPTDDLMGRVCVVGLDDCQVIVKRIRHGRTRGRFDLYDNSGDMILADQGVFWAARVEFIRPAD